MGERRAEVGKSGLSQGGGIEMEWEYWIEGMVGGEPMREFQEKLNNLGLGRWEAVAAWSEPPKDRQSFVFILFKRPRSK